MVIFQVNIFFSITETVYLSYLILSFLFRFFYDSNSFSLCYIMLTQFTHFIWRNFESKKTYVGGYVLQFGWVVKTFNPFVILYDNSFVFGSICFDPTVQHNTATFFFIHFFSAVCFCNASFAKLHTSVSEIIFFFYQKKTLFFLNFVICVSFSFHQLAMLRLQCITM